MTFSLTKTNVRDSIRVTPPVEDTKRECTRRSEGVVHN